MARRLFNVANLFTIHGRGIVLLPGIVPIDEEQFGPGDPLLLKRPDGTELQTRIKWLEWRGTWVGEPPNPRPWSVLLEGLTEDDVPQGTEVWSVDAERRADNQTTMNPASGQGGTGAAGIVSVVRRLLERRSGR